MKNIVFALSIFAAELIINGYASAANNFQNQVNNNGWPTPPTIDLDTSDDNEYGFSTAVGDFGENHWGHHYLMTDNGPVYYSSKNYINKKYQVKGKRTTVLENALYSNNPDIFEEALGDDANLNEKTKWGQEPQTVMREKFNYPFTPPSKKTQWGNLLELYGETTKTSETVPSSPVSFWD